jgi:hypothetical protein
LNVSKYIVILDVGNDDQSFTKTDRFRSAAVDISLYKNRGTSLIGYSIGMKLWHGDYSSQLYLNRKQTYILKGTYGGDYSLGLLYFSFIYNCFKISLGYDSDKIRTTFQNNMHQIMNNGMVPEVSRSNRIYMELALFGNNSQY